MSRTRYANWLRHVWTPEGKTEVPGFRRGQDRFRQLAFSPDGNYLLAIASVGGCLLWDRPGGRLVPLPGPAAGATAAAWEPKTGLLAVGGRDGSIRLLAPPAFTPVEELSAEGEVAVLAFSRDGRRLAWGGSKGARVWDRQTKQYCTPLLPHGGPVATLAFSSDGVMLATSARDLKARVFRADSDHAGSRLSSGPPFPGRIRHQSRRSRARRSAIRGTRPDDPDGGEERLPLQPPMAIGRDGRDPHDQRDPPRTRLPRRHST